MKIRVLIAEPDDALREIYSRYLSTLGFSIETARTLGECARKAVAFQPNVIMSELDFSDGSADQLFGSTRHNAVTSAPVVVVTRRETRRHVGWPGQEYFEKPVAMARLVESLRHCAAHPIDAVS